MSIADIAIIVIMLISITIGIIRGFWKTMSKAITLLVSLALGFLLATKIAPQIFKGDILNVINDFFQGLIVKTDTANGTLSVVNDAWMVTVGGAEIITLEAALGRMFIPSFFQGPIIASTGALVDAGAIHGEVTVGALVSSAYTHYATIVLSGIIVFTVSLIITRVIAKLVYDALNYKKFLRASDRVLGGVLRILTGGTFVFILLHIIGLLSGFEFMAPVMEDIANSKIAKPLYEANLLNKIFYGANMQQITDIFSNLIMSIPGIDKVPEVAMAMSMM